MRSETKRVTRTDVERTPTFNGQAGENKPAMETQMEWLEREEDHRRVKSQKIQGKRV